MPALGASAPHTIFGTKPCPIMSSQNLWLSLGCPDPIQLTVWAKRKQQWSAEMSNQTLLVVPDPVLVHLSRPNLSWKHPLGIIGDLMLEHHPGCSCQFSGNSPDGNNAIGPGLFSFIETLRQWLKAYRKMRRF